MEEVIKRQLEHLREKIYKSKSRTEFNENMKAYNELYLDWIMVHKKWGKKMTDELKPYRVIVKATGNITTVMLTHQDWVYYNYKDRSVYAFLA